MKKRCLQVIAVVGMIAAGCGRSATTTRATTPAPPSTAQIVSQVCTAYRPLYDKWMADILMQGELRSALLPLDTQAQTIDGRNPVKSNLRALLIELSEPGSAAPLGADKLAASCGIPKINR